LVDDVAKNAADSTNALTQAMNANGEAAGILSGMWSSLTASIFKGGGAMKDYIKSLGDGSVKSLEASRSINALSAAVLGASKIFANNKVDVSGFESITDQMTTAIDMASKVKGGLAGMAAAMNVKVPAGVSDVAGFLKQVAINMGNATDAAQKYQNAYMQMIVASQGGSALFRQAGGDLSKLQGVLNNQIDAVAGVARQTGIALPTINDFYMQMGKIPGALTEVSDATNKMGVSMMTWQNAVNLGISSGMGLQGVLKQNEIAYDTFGEVGDRANEFIARQAELTDKLPLSLDKATSYLDDMAQAFKYVGDNSIGASAAMQKMFNGLKEGGMGVEGIRATMLGLGQAISNMGEAQEAFISARSGGPGGIKGAIDFEGMLRDKKGGGMDKALDMMKQAYLKQIGGKVLTEQEAIKTGQEEKFFQQRKVLMSGAFFGGAIKDKNQATEFMSALAAPKGQASNEKLADLMQTSNDRAQKMADQNRTSMTNIEVSAQSLAAKGGLELLATVKAGLGVSNDKVQKQLAIEQVNASKLTTRAAEATKTGQNPIQATTAADVKGAVGGMVDVIAGMPEAIKTNVAPRFMHPASPESKAADMAMQRSQAYADRNLADAQSSGQMLMDAMTKSSKSPTSMKDNMHATTMQAAAVAAHGKPGTTSQSGTNVAPPQPPATPNNRPINIQVYVNGLPAQSHSVVHDLDNKAPQ
jgi:hypothetical protein